MTDNELIARLRERGCWYDFNDKSTWFQDEDLTVPALQPEDVRYVKNKIGPGYMKTVLVEKDGQDRYFVDCSGAINMYTYFLANKPIQLLSNLEAMEQRFMQDMGIYPKVQE